MSTTPRPPLLSDEEIIDETWVPDMSSWEPAGAYEAGMHWTRRYYEDLITDGKLRVVEEVCFDESSHCLHCGYDVTDRSEPRSPEVPPYCHGCGNKIKR